jgi:hypothetical protein
VLVLALTVATGGAVVAWIADRRRSRNRNGRAACGACGSSWLESGESYLIHGRLVCEECARKAKRKMPWELGALAGWAALIAAIGVSNLLSGNLAGAALLIVAPTILVPIGTVQLMKLANRRAQRRIAAGEFPGLDASDAEGGTSLTDGSAV